MKKENDELTNLVIDYQETKAQAVLSAIFKLLEKTIKDKAKYIYNTKYFPISHYYGASEKKGTFNLRKSNLCDIEDVRQELIVEVIRIINNFNPKLNKKFMRYLLSCVWNWRPAFITADFIGQITSEKLYKINSEGEEELTEQLMPEDLNRKFIDIDLAGIESELTTPLEKKVLSVLLNSKGLTQVEIAKEAGVSKQMIGMVIAKIKNILKST